jgi:Fe2+ or Zn2+ uptake regulation protein
MNSRSKPPKVQSSNVDARVDPRREIVEYLRRHPEAADTVDGILDWWMPAQRNENARNEIQEALREFVEQGLIEEVVLGNGHRLYRLAGRKDKTL